MQVEKICLICGNKYHVRRGRAAISKYCSNPCRYKRSLSEDGLRIISKSSSEKFIKNPNLRLISSENGKRAIRILNERGKRFIMPVGYHTDAHKEYMSNLMRNREITWRDKIKDNHWSKSAERNLIVDKILHTRRLNETTQTVEYKSRLANWSINNLDKMTSRFERGECFNRTTECNEWYRSSYERLYMEMLNGMSCVVRWTTKHGIVIPYRAEDGGYRRYFPDFLVEYGDGRVEMVEVKGWIKDMKSFNMKCKVGKLYCDSNNITYRVLFKKELIDERC